VNLQVLSFIVYLLYYGFTSTNEVELLTPPSPPEKEQSKNMQRVLSDLKDLRGELQQLRVAAVAAELRAQAHPNDARIGTNMRSTYTYMYIYVYIYI
jgi:hypothetical protein